MSDIPEGWYPDPNDERNERWWDGAQWTVGTRSKTPQVPPLAPPQPAAPPSPQLNMQPAEEGPPPWAAEVVSMEPVAIQSIDRPWWKKKRFAVPLAGLVVLVIVAALASLDDDGGSDVQAAEETTATSTEEAVDEEQATTSDAPTTSATPTTSVGVGETVEQPGQTTATQLPPSSVVTDSSERGVDLFGGNDPEDLLMPYVVCMSLQEAQNEIQDHGVFFSRSIDATGADRMQIFDRNWVVVGQEPPPGSPIGEFEAVLEVEKYTETDRCK